MLDGSETPPVPGAAPLAARPPQATQPAPQLIYEGAPSWKSWFWSYFAAGLLCLALVGFVIIVLLNWSRRSRRYRITDRNIDYEVGALSKRIETLQLWRVHDLD